LKKTNGNCATQMLELCAAQTIEALDLVHSPKGALKPVGVRRSCGGQFLQMLVGSTVSRHSANDETTGIQRFTDMRNYFWVTWLAGAPRSSALAQALEARNIPGSNRIQTQI